MSLKVMSWVFEHSDATLGARLVLLALAEKAHDDGGRAFPSVETLVAKTRMSRRGVQDALRRLEADGHVVNEGRSAFGTTLYRVVMGGAESAPPAPRDVPEGAQISTSGGAPTAPNPSLTRPSSSPAGEEETRGRALMPASEEPIGFSEWLTYHADRTGRRVPRAGTSTRSDLARSFARLVGEGYELADFKAVSDYAALDPFWREKSIGFAWALRFGEFEDRAENGRRLAAQQAEEPESWWSRNGAFLKELGETGRDPRFA